MTSKEIMLYIKKVVLQATEDDNNMVIIKSGDIYNDLNLKNLMPIVCSAMRNIGKLYEYEIIEESPKRNGSRVIYKYLVK